MSWKDNIEQVFRITTGDGKVFTPLWRNPVKSVEYNIAEFEFVNIEGALVNRRKPKARRFDLEFYFDGENHIEDGIDFENSAKDSRPWNIFHPIYGELIVQPTGLNFDNRNVNLTAITGTVIETITDEIPKNTINQVEKIHEDSEIVSDNLNNSYANNVSPDSTDVVEMQSKTASSYNETKKKIKSPLDSEEYFNKFNTANAAVLNATAFPLEAIREMNAMISAPSLFADSVKNRIEMLTTSFNLLRAKIENITDRKKKILFEANAATTINAMLLSAASPLAGDYDNKPAVIAVIDSILNPYNQFLQDLDFLQSNNYGNVDSYIPDFTGLYSLNSLVNFTTSSLLAIALDSKQERTIFLEEDSNAILLAHRFYGLLPDDSTIDAFMAQNNIKLSELLLIKKGRKILYYI